MDNVEDIKLKYIEHRLEFEKQNFINLLPEHLKDDFKKYAFIAGGCIYSLYNYQEPKDYDFFIKNEKFVKKLREYFIELSGYHGKTISGGTYKDYPLIITDNAISVGKYQIITRFVGTPKEVVGEFDFKHNMFYYDNNRVDTVSDFDCLDSKELKYNDKRARDICGTIIRTNKFVKRGMTINNSEMSKMLLKLNDVGFNERELEILHESKQKTEGDHFGS